MSNHTLGRLAKRGIAVIAAAICSGAIIALTVATLFTSTGTASAATSGTGTATPTASPSGDPWG